MRDDLKSSSSESADEAVLLDAFAAARPRLLAMIQRLNHVPVNQEILKVKLPHPKEAQLPNGLTLMVLEQHKLPTISVTLWIKSGALSDPKDMPGLASFAADLLRDGTSKRSGTQIAAELDEIGAAFGANAGFGSNLTSITASGLSESADKLMDLMAKGTIGSGGKITGKDWFTFARRAGVSWIKSNDAAVGAVLSTVKVAPLVGADVTTFPARSVPTLSATVAAPTEAMSLLLAGRPRAIS